MRNHSTPGIAKAREMSGAAKPAKATKSPVGAEATPSKKDTAATSSVSGRVELADAMKAKARPDDTVFIFARAVNADGSPGSRMPLAVQRAKVVDLPMNFMLDDSMARRPRRKFREPRNCVSRPAFRSPATRLQLPVTSPDKAM